MNELELYYTCQSLGNAFNVFLIPEKILGKKTPYYRGGAINYYYYNQSNVAFVPHLTKFKK